MEEKQLADLGMFTFAARITNTTRKCALLLYQAGFGVQKIFGQLEETGREDAYIHNRRYEIWSNLHNAGCIMQVAGYVLWPWTAWLNQGIVLLLTLSLLVSRVWF